MSYNLQPTTHMEGGTGPLSAPACACAADDTAEIDELIKKHGVHRVLSILCVHWDPNDIINRLLDTCASTQSGDGAIALPPAAPPAASPPAACEGASHPAACEGEGAAIHVRMVYTDRCAMLGIKEAMCDRDVLAWHMLCKPREGTVPMSIQLPCASINLLASSVWAESYCMKDLKWAKHDAEGTAQAGESPASWRLRATIRIQGQPTAIGFSRKVVQIASKRTTNARQGILAYEWCDELTHHEGCAIVLKADRERLTPMDLPAGQRDMFKGKFKFVVVLEFTPIHGGSSLVTLQLPQAGRPCPSDGVVRSDDWEVQPKWLCFAAERALADRARQASSKRARDDHNEAADSLANLGNA